MENDYLCIYTYEIVRRSFCIPYSIIWIEFEPKIQILV